MITLDGYDAGDAATLRLLVVPDGGVPADGTTTAVLALTDPAGTAMVVPAAQPAGEDRSRWSTTLVLPVAGIYTGVWTVTGTGAGKQPVEVLVGPTAGPYPGRSYASTTQLAEFLGAAPPRGAHRLLVRATERIDELLRTAVYEVDADELPVDPDIAAALAEATCAQVEWFVETGEDGTGLAERYSDVQIGSVRLSAGRRDDGGGSDAPDPRYAPGAIRALRKVPGLTGAAAGPLVVW